MTLGQARSHRGNGRRAMICSSAGPHTDIGTAMMSGVGASQSGLRGGVTVP